MKNFLTIIPAWSGGKLPEVVEDCLTSPTKNSPELYPGVMVVTRESDKETFNTAKKLTNQYDNVKVLYGENFGKTNFAREALNYVYEKEIIFKPYGNPILKPDLIGFIDHDAQQKWSEAFSMVNELEDCKIGHIQRRRPIKMKPEKIETQAFLNEVVYEALEKKGHDVSSLSEDPISGLGPGRGVKDLQNNVCGTYDAFKRIGPKLIGKIYSLELEVTLLSFTDPETEMIWGERNDYGEPGPTTYEKLANNLAEKFWVASEHIPIPLPEIRKIADKLEFEGKHKNLKEKVILPALDMAQKNY